MTLTLTLPKGEFLYNGKQVTFKTPCDSEGLTGLIVEGVAYDIVNALGTQLVANSFDVGAMVSVIFDTNDNKAYVQNADTNAYLEGKFNEILSSADKYVHPSTHPASMITETDAIKMFLAEEREKLAGIEHNANKYTHPETHPADMITETDKIKMFLATERVKLAGIEEKANRYVHPDTHPASMISGLADTVKSLGFGYCVVGSSSSTPVSVSTNFTPVLAIVCDSRCAVTIVSRAKSSSGYYGVSMYNNDEVKDAGATWGNKSVTIKPYITGYSCYYVVFGY